MPFFLLLLKAFVELKVGRKTKTYSFQIFCKVKDWTQRVSKLYNHDREVHVCGYAVDGVESKRIRCSMILSLPSNILGMANLLIILHGPSCVHFIFMGLHVPPSFFSIHSSCPYWREFWERLYGVWNIKEDMNEWMVWKCYPSGVEVLTYGGGVYVILDYESMKRNSQRSQHLTKLKVIQVACNKVVSL